MNKYIDENTFWELNTKVGSCWFKVKNKNGCKIESGVNVGIGTINGIKVVFVLFNTNRNKGAIGVNEGERITKAFEYATKKKLPVIAIVSSSGIKVTEGTVALMQMAKMIASIKRHSDKKLLYIAVVTDITLGGISASIVPLADIIVAEQNAIYGFTGKRIIEKTLQVPLPDDFQTASYAKRNGMVDIVEKQDEIKSILSKLLKLHGYRCGYE